MKVFQTLLFLAVIILIGGMAALYWGKTVEDATAPVEVVDDFTVPANAVDEPVEEPSGQDVPIEPIVDTPTPSAILPIVVVTEDLPSHMDSFGFMVDEETGQSVWVEGNTLFVNVGYSGGCQEHEFTMYWNGLWAESAPPQTGVRLIHDANDDFCEAGIGPKHSSLI